MATIIVEDPKTPESVQPQKSDGESAETIRLAQEAGRVTESNRQLQQELAEVKAQYEEMRRSGEADRTSLAELRATISDLKAALEEDDEPEAVEKVTPPPVEEKPKEEEKPKRPRSLLQKLLYG